MADTTNRGYPKPVSTNLVSGDVALLQAALDAIDGDVHDLFTAMSGKAASDHTHSISGIEGLTSALVGKASTTHSHALSSLTDVSGAAAAPATGQYVLVKEAIGWVPREAATLIGEHSHTISDITDLPLVLATFATQTYVDGRIAAVIGAAPVALDTLTELAAALGDDPSFATTIIGLIGSKINKAGDTNVGLLVSIAGFRSTGEYGVDSVTSASGNYAFRARAKADDSVAIIQFTNFAGSIQWGTIKATKGVVNVSAAVLQEQGQRVYSPNNPQPVPGFAEVGSYVLAKNTSGVNAGPGAYVSGAVLVPASAYGDVLGGPLPGIWQVAGGSNSSGSVAASAVSAYRRYN